MKKRVLWALAVLNVALLVSLVMRLTGEQPAIAQVHRPADYLMIPGEVNGGASAVIYVIDQSNGWLGAMAYDDARHELNAMTPIEMGRVFENRTTNSPTGSPGAVAVPGGKAPAGGPAR